MKTDRFYETFTIEINDINAQGEGFLNLIWENTMVKIPLNPLTVAPEKPVVAAVGTPVVKTETMPNTVVGQKIPSSEGGLVVDKKAQFTPILAAYYGVKDALVGDNGKDASAQGKTLKTALMNLDTKNWTSKERNDYQTLAKKMETDAEQIGNNAAKIDRQREHFMSLSTSLLAITKTLKINAEAAYLQFCPMANNNKGAFWLSKDSKVKNPYFGKSMLTCGSVKETLK